MSSPILDLGNGVILSDFGLHGGHLSHPTSEGETCPGEADLSFDSAAPFHFTIVSAWPLTVAEFINCSVCGIKGKITNGRWVGEWLPVGPSAE